jgi:hypothetical protein
VKNGTGNKCINKDNTVSNTVKRIGGDNIVAVALALVFPASAQNSHSCHPVKEVAEGVDGLADYPVHKGILAKVSADGSLGIKAVPHSPVRQHLIHRPYTQGKYCRSKEQKKYAPARKLQNIEANQL